MALHGTTRILINPFAQLHSSVLVWDCWNGTAALDLYTTASTDEIIRGYSLFYLLLPYLLRLDGGALLGLDKCGWLCYDLLLPFSLFKTYSLHLVIGQAERAGTTIWKLSYLVRHLDLCYYSTYLLLLNCYLLD